MRLNEMTRRGFIKGVGAAGIGAVAGTATNSMNPTPPPLPSVSTDPYNQQDIEDKAKSEKDKEIEDLSDKVVSKYNIDTDLARTIVVLTKKYEHPTFPRAEDLLSIIGIESSFNPNAVSGLKKDPAVGLTQIRPGVWGIDPEELSGDMEKQISLASDILTKYNRQLKSPRNAVHAYNVGETAFRRGKHNPSYVQKFEKERTLYK